MTKTTDPLAAKQWHFSAIGLDRLRGEFDGTGVWTGIFDDGVDKLHEDLAANYDATREFKVGGVALAPNVGASNHGTAVAGIIGAAANGIGGVGISSGAKITGVDVFGNAGGSNMLAAVRHMASFDTVNNSWGWTSPFADGLTTGFGRQLADALKLAADTGRGGLGTAIVNSAGNEWGSDSRTANFQEFSASRYTITVGAIGQNGDVAFYSNRGSSLLVSAPSNGGGAGISTTDQTGAGGYSSGNYTDGFGGTSAAAPIVTGVVNLMLGASGKVLGWRDVQDILAITADHTTPTSIGGAVTGRMAYGWQINGARTVDGGGMHYSHDVGFGQVDAFEAVRFAEVWANFGPAQTSANEASASVGATINRALSDKATTAFGIAVSKDIVMEHADLTLTLNHANVKELRVELVSPDGTKSILMDAMTGAPVGGTAWTWTFGTEAVRGVSSLGTWTVRVTDTKTGNAGVVTSYKLDVYGDAPSANSVYHYTDEFLKLASLSPSRSALSDLDGGTDWINLSAMTGDTRVDLSTTAGSFNVGTSTIAIRGTIENVVTGDGADRLVGNESANRLLGMRGDDVLEGKGGADVVDGGAGIDTASYASSDAAVTVDLRAATQVGGHAQGDRLVSVENVVGSAHADRITGDAGANVLTGGGGNDVLDGGAGRDVATFAGRAADYVIAKGTDALGAWTTLTDLIAGRDGTDRAYGVEAFRFADKLVELAALVAAPSQPAATTSPGTTFVATTRADLFTGSAGNDTFRFVEGGLGGSDRFDGGAGIDTLDLSGLSARTRVVVQLNSGDSFSVGASYGVAKNVENVTGSAGNDTIYGNALANRIDGGAGNDILRGYGGRDVFSFGARSGTDMIYDFTQGEDRLDFGKSLSALTVRASGSNLVVSDEDSTVVLVGGSKLALTAHDFVMA